MKETEEKQQGENWHGQQEKAQCAGRQRKAGISAKRSGGFSLYAHIAVSCNAVAYITGNVAVGNCQTRTNELQVFGKKSKYECMYLTT